MNYMEWEDSFNLDIESIDQQHSKLVEIINLLYETTQPDSSKDELHALVDVLDKEARAINKMLEYTVFHFRYEENLLQENQYPEYKSHKQRHDSFTKEVAMYKKHFDSAENVDVNEMMSFLKSWLREHILIEDKKYVPYLKK